MSARYLRDQWEAKQAPSVKRGDYVVATKYRDGDPGDEFCIGFYDECYKNGSSTRHLVLDSEGKQFRNNGFRRVARVGSRRGEWMVAHVAHIERMKDRFSVWHWYRAPWSELESVNVNEQATQRLMRGPRFDARYYD